MILRSTLAEFEAGDRGAGGSESGRDRVQRWCLKPAGRPLHQVEPAPLLQGGEEVGKSGVGEAVATEVGAQPVPEGFDPDGPHQLLQGRRTLAVGDPVEVEKGLIGGRDRVGNAMCRGTLVLAIGPQLHAGVEVLPDLSVAQIIERQIGDIGGERLVQPQVLPPLHRDQIAKPHVSQFVGEVLGAAAHLVGGRRLAEHDGVRVRDVADVLHPAPVELGHEHVVRLVEGIRLAEQVGEVVDDLPAKLEQTGGILFKVPRQ